MSSSSLPADLSTLESSVAAIPTSAVKNIQYVSIVTAIGASTGDLTITAIVIANSIFVRGANNKNAASPMDADETTHVSFINTTTIRGSSYAAITGASTGVQGWIVEYN